MKKYLPYAILGIVIILGCAYIHNLKSNIDYADIECPKCGSNEVLDYGEDEQGNHDCQCYDCKTMFVIVC